MSDPITRLNAALEGRYRIERELGQGGMATVYLAHDLKHDRQVALKLLRPELAAVVGAERFLAEIRTTANLQHPHVLALFDSGEADTFVYYVMPYVAGESLRERLDREKQLPVGESVRLAAAVAGALDHAHRKGVIHRDIKPANILLQDGQPVVADFGIALAVGAAGGARLTETGLSVGTPYYMSPEQATGDQHVGPGSDIYALGCVLYEMLVGDPPYTGSTAQAVLGKIISGDPVTPREHRPSVPANVDAAVRCALERLPADRFESADDFARALGDPAFRHGAGAEGDGRITAGFWKPFAIVASAVAVIAMAVAGTVSDRSAAQVRDVGLRHDAPMQMGVFRNFAVSRDGSFIVYEAGTGDETQLWVRSLTDQASRPLQGTEGAYGMPRISPDGSRVAFASGGDLKIASLDGGPISTIAQAFDPTGGEWTEDGLITFGDRDGRVFRWIDPETGPVREDPVGYCINANMLSSGELLCGGGGDKNGILKRLDEPSEFNYWRSAGRGGGSARAVPGSDFRAVDADYVVYLSIDGTLMGTRIEDRDSLLFGQSVALVPEVRRETYTGAGQFEITDDGTLVYVPGLNAESGRLVRVAPNGQEQDFPIEDGAHLRFTTSPDGRSFASVVDGLQDQELRLYDLRTGVFQSLDRASYIGTPVWSPEADHVVYARSGSPEADAIARLEIDSNAGVRDFLTGDPFLFMVPMTYLSQDSLLVGQTSGSGAARMVDPTSSPPAVEPVGVDAFFVEISPDRRWIVYQNQSTPGIQLQPWPDLDRRFLVDPDGQDPQWASSTQFVYWAFMSETATLSSGAGLYSVTVDPTRNPPFEDPELVVSDAHFADTPGQSFEILPGGDIVYKRSPTENLGYYVRVVPGWVEEMKRRVDEANR